MMSVHVLDSLCVCMLILVALHVQGQVVGAREAAAAGNALERFGAGVLAVVSGELVRPGEAPVAVVPRAAIRLLTCNAEKQKRRHQQRANIFGCCCWRPRGATVACSNHVGVITLLTRLLVHSFHACCE